MDAASWARMLNPKHRFVNVDFAMLSGLQPWMLLPMHVSGYDINCQYRIHFDERIAWFRDNLSAAESIRLTFFPFTLAGIGKFHESAHTVGCQFKHSFHFLPGVGMTDGEAPERIWATLNALGSRTREMSAGHRHDIINDHHSDMNVRRVHGMGEYAGSTFSRGLTSDRFSAGAPHEAQRGGHAGCSRRGGSCRNRMQAGGLDGGRLEGAGSRVARESGRHEAPPRAAKSVRGAEGCRCAGLRPLQL